MYTITGAFEKYKEDGTLEVWACCYYHRDFTKKVNRKVMPVKVTIKFREGKKIEDLRETINLIYYFDNYFELIKEDGKTLKYSGNTREVDSDLKLFQNYEECENYYNGEIFKSIGEAETEKRNVEAKMDKLINSLKESFTNSDYIIETLKR